MRSPHRSQSNAESRLDTALTQARALSHLLLDGAPLSSADEDIQRGIFWLLNDLIEAAHDAHGDLSGKKAVVPRE